MKKLLAINLLLVFLATPLFSFAATPAGLTPKSPLYFLDTFFERINLALTFNPEKKATKALLFAEERLAEVATSANEDKPEVIGALMANYENNVSLATEKSKEVKDEKKAEELFNKIADNTAKHQEVLTEVLAKVPEVAKEAIEKALEASKKGQEEALKQVAELKQAVVELKQEIAELKKQQKIEPAPPTNTQGQSSIQELKKEIEVLKKQTAEKGEKQITAPAVPAVPAVPALEPKTEVKVEEKPLILTNSIGISYTFDTRTNNNQKIQALIDVGFFVTQGKLPEGIKVKTAGETPPDASLPATTPATPVTSTPAPVIPAPTPVPPITLTQPPSPKIFKELTLTASDSFCGGLHPTLGTSCGSSVVYSERREGEIYSQVKYDVPITVSIDDPQGKIVVPNNNPDGTSRTPQLLEGNPVTISTQWIGSGTRGPGANFTYYPSNLGAEPYTFCSNAADPTCSGFRITRTVTVTANGITVTKTFTDRYYPLELPKPTLPYFVADINFDKNTIANNEIDSIKVTILTKDSSGKILPNKSVQIQTPYKTESLVSDSNGIINTIITTTQSANTYTFTVRADNYSNSKNYQVINVRKKLSFGVLSAAAFGNIQAPAINEGLIMLVFDKNFSEIQRLTLKKVSFKLEGLTPDWITNIKLTKSEADDRADVLPPIIIPSTYSFGSDGVVSLIPSEPIEIFYNDRLTIVADIKNNSDQKSGTGVKILEYAVIVYQDSFWFSGLVSGLPGVITPELINWGNNAPLVLPSRVTNWIVTNYCMGGTPGTYGTIVTCFDQ